MLNRFRIKQRAKWLRENTVYFDVLEYEETVDHCLIDFASQVGWSPTTGLVTVLGEPKRGVKVFAQEVGGDVEALKAYFDVCEMDLDFRLLSSQ